MIGSRGRARRCRYAGVATATIAAALAVGAFAPASAEAGRNQWSIFEDHRAIVGATPSKRQRTLEQIRALGADTLRVEVRWREVAPAPSARLRPAFDATDPGQYPGFAPYDDAIARASALGMRVLVTITGDAPRWATAGGKGRSFRTANWKPSAVQYGRFAAAVARRYSGEFIRGLSVRWFSIWNEPNHIQFLKPARSAAGIYRKLVDAAIPQIRRNGPRHAKILVGETAPSASPGKAIGPKAFIRRWLCLDRRLRRTSRGSGCRHFRRIDADGYAHHPYGPVERVPRKKDVINLLAIGRLAHYLDRAAHARRLRQKLGIYSTEFGLQSNPPDNSVSTTPSRQARLLNEKEEYSYRYGRLRSYSQYLLVDDPPRPGPRSLRWAGFQTGLRFPSGRRKPAWAAYRLPIVVHRRRRGVYVWGHVRPGSGARYVRLQKRRGSHYVASGPRIRTNSSGYFGVRRRNPPGSFRYRAYDEPRRALIGTSRTAAPRP
jgi:hypothetical protein